MGTASKNRIIQSLPHDLHGWVEEKYPPPKTLHFELLMLKDHEGKLQQGWWNGFKWDYSPKKIKKVFKWRLLTVSERLTIEDD